MNTGLMAMTVATGLALCAGSFCARAATISATENNPAVQVCQAALPSYEGGLRKRPKAIVNEGTTNAFVSCGLPGHGFGGGIGPNTAAASVRLLNEGAAPVTVICTATDVLRPGGMTRSATLTPGTSRPMIFYASDMSAGVWYTAAFSCNLPPGAGILDIWHTFKLEVGA